MTTMPCHITDQHVSGDPQDAEDQDHLCRCGELRRPGDEFCPACEQDYRDSIREAAEFERALELQSVIEDIGLSDYAKAVSGIDPVATARLAGALKRIWGQS